ncbi:hypothetical protein IRZ83_13410 [Flavobacterium sp. JLP]|uniref:hypothetical protein n=1 Tax=Flavobacterium sp. JLP TaxID=2783793 RepID=UPI00188B4E64|nr:hypothetical protein [Flavobacterium sp. JLP]MBF4507668.1 hypothetical protein [Flavobacterium sp. JLP]
MKYVLIFIILFLCISNEVIKKEELEFRIVNKSITNGSNIDVELVNNSKKDYYLLLDTTSFYNKLAPFNASEFLQLANIGIKDNYNNVIDLEFKDYQCYNNLEYKNHVKSKNILKIKSNHKVYFSIPFKLRTDINENCWYGYQIQKMKIDRKYFCFLMNVKPDEYLRQKLPMEVKDSLMQMGYELYEKEIISNKVALILR